MWIGLLWIIGCYGISIMLLHVLFGARKRKHVKPTRVLLVTKNNENHIEWYIRSLYFFSRMKGNEVVTAIFDNDSSDATTRIIERLSQTHALECYEQADDAILEQYMDQHLDERLIVVNISQREEIVKIPIAMP